jgi:hypothetical protein
VSQVQREYNRCITHPYGSSAGAALLLSTTVNRWISPNGDRDFTLWGKTVADVKRGCVHAIMQVFAVLIRTLVGNGQQSTALGIVSVGIGAMLLDNASQQ